MRDHLPPKPPPPVVHAPAGMPRKQKRMWAWISVVIVVAIGLLVARQLYLAHLYKERDRIRSRINLNQIGISILMHTSNFRGQFPDSFGDLILTDHVSPALFVAPNSHDTPATGSTPREIAANFAAPGHCSYVYLGKGLNIRDASSTTVVAYEPSEINDGGGGNVLFGDGHIDFVEMPGMNSILEQAKSGVRPVHFPRSGATPPTATP